MGAEITLLIYSALTLQNKKRRQSEANHIYPTLQMQPSLFQGQSFGNQVTHYELCLSLKLHKERNNLTSLLSSQNKETKQRFWTDQKIYLTFNMEDSSNGSVKNSPASERDMGSIPNLGRSHMLVCHNSWSSSLGPRSYKYWDQVP